MMHGLLEFLTGPSLAAKQLRPTLVLVPAAASAVPEVLEITDLVPCQFRALWSSDRFGAG